MNGPTQEEVERLANEILNPPLILADDDATNVAAWFTERASPLVAALRSLQTRLTEAERAHNRQILAVSGNRHQPLTGEATMSLNVLTNREPAEQEQLEWLWERRDAGEPDAVLEAVEVLGALATNLEHAQPTIAPTLPTTLRQIVNLILGMDERRIREEDDTFFPRLRRAIRGQPDDAATNNEIQSLRSQLNEARQDRERLDWLEQSGALFDVDTSDPKHIIWRLTFSIGSDVDDLRSAIDAARDSRE